MQQQNIVLSKIFYYLGAAIVIAGAIFLVAQNWSEIGATGRILTTLGIGIIAYVSAVLLATRSELDSMSQAITAISGILTPVGIFIVLDEAQVALSTINMNILVSLLMVIFFAASLFIFRKVVYTVFTIIFASWLYMAVVADILDNVSRMGAWYDFQDIYRYAAIVLGLALMCIGYYLADHGDTVHKRLTPILYSFGGIIVLGVLLTFGGAWDIIYPFIIAGVLYLSVYLQSKAMLRLGSTFLIFYLIRLTNVYFSNMLTWPVILIIFGVLLIGIGYLTVYLSKKYMVQNINQ